MLASGGREATYALFAFCCVVLKAEGFLSPLTLPIGGVAKGVHSERRCIRVPRLSVTPPGKSNGGTAAAGSEESGGTFAGEEGRGIRRAPLRITPNFQPQENRRPKTDVESDPITYGAFLTEQSFDIAAMAWAEFSDWLRRTVKRNVDGAQFEFDIRQWSSSIRKWWRRAIEMDVQAKADLFRLYDRGMQERDAWGNQAVKVDARVEDEWDSIYVECLDCFESSGSSSSSSGGVDLRASSSWPRGTTTAAAAATSAAFTELSSSSSEYSSGSAMAAFGMYGGEGEQEAEDDGEEEEEGGQSEGEDSEEEIIDCAIRGRWTFKNNDDPPHFSPQ